MKRIFNAFLTLAMVITAGMTLTSCSVDDNPTTPQNSLAQQLVGEWINEYDYSGTGDILIVTIYHFYGDGTCWKELNLRQGNEVFDQTDSRYATSQSTYTIDASGRVVMTVRDADRGTEETEVLTFDGTHLSVTYVEKPIIMVRATDAQIQFYQAEADAWHGGSDDGGEGRLLSAATRADYGKVVCAAGHLHPAKTAVPDGCTAVGILGKVTEIGHGLILSLYDATPQNWFLNILNWKTEKAFAGTRLKILPDDAARGTNLTSYTTLGDIAVSNWAVAQKDDYEAIFTNLGSTTGNQNGKTYDDNVNAYITTGVGGNALSEHHYITPTKRDDSHIWYFDKRYWGSLYTGNGDPSPIRPVLGF